MKLFKWWHKLIIVLFVAAIAALFLVVAFKSKDEDVQRWSLFSSMFFGIATICLSMIALTISIDTYRKTNKQEYEKIQNEANKFIIENNPDIEYVPLCLIANIYDNHRKYIRNIYTSFNKLSSDVRNEVLKQLNYDAVKVYNKSWIKDSLDRIRKFIKEYELGSDYILDFYEKSLDYSKDSYGINDADVNIISSRYLGAQSLRFENGECYDNCITFRKYCALYFNAKLSNNKLLKAVPKPLDELNALARLTESDEKSICFWTIYVIDVILGLIKQDPKLKIKEDLFPKVHADIKTFEDRFLLSLIGVFDLNKYVEAKQ